MINMCKPFSVIRPIFHYCNLKARPHQIFSFIIVTDYSYIMIFCRNRGVFVGQRRVFAIVKEMNF